MLTPTERLTNINQLQLEHFLSVNYSNSNIYNISYTF